MYIFRYLLDVRRKEKQKIRQTVVQPLGFVSLKFCSYKVIWSKEKCTKIHMYIELQLTHYIN